MERRDFLRLGAQLGGVAAIGASPAFHAMEASALDQQRATTYRSILEQPPAESGIDTVVIVMMENRSFDSYLGWLAKSNFYLDRGRRRYGATFAISGAQRHQYPASDGSLVATRHYPIHSGPTDIFHGCGHHDPGHGWIAGRAERDGGFLAPASGNDEFALSFWRGDDLPMYKQLAFNFTVCDRWHASQLGPTYPNREYFLSGQSGGHKDNYLPFAEGGFQWPALFDRLGAANVTVRDYASDFPPILLFGGRAGPLVRSIADYHTDCAAGTLGQVNYVDPKFLEPGENDDHPLADFRAGQIFIRDTFAAFARSPQWERGLFVVLYDEWGGFFDHIPPPILPDERASAVDVENFGQAGFRVPAILASPRALPGYVDRAPYDHTSIIRFLEWRFLGAPPHGTGGSGWWLTSRDRSARNAGRTLSSDVFDPAPRFDLDMALPDPTPACDAPGTAGSASGVDGVHPFAEARDAGYLERVGFKL